MVRAFSLKPRQFAPHQLELLRRVVYLREQEKLTFKGIRQRLNANGYPFSRGKPLSAELRVATHTKKDLLHKHPTMSKKGRYTSKRPRIVCGEENGKNIAQGGLPSK